MKYLLKLITLFTLKNSLIELSKSDTLHFNITTDQLTATRAAIYILSGMSTEQVKQHSDLLKKIAQLEQQRVDLESHNSLLVLEANGWQDKIDRMKEQLSTVEV